MINFYILYHVFSSLSAGVMTVQEHKNEGGAGAFFATLVPHYLMTVSYLFSPLGYISFAIHFVNLVKGNVRSSIFFLLLSLSIVTSGLIALSRSITVQYLLVYIIVFFFLYPTIEKKVRKRIMLYSTIIVSLIIFLLFVVSDSRFSAYYTKKSLNEAFIDETENPTLFSTLDYFSEWEENAPIMISKHDISHTYYGLYNSFGIGAHIVPNVYNSIQDELKRHLKDIATSFHGLIGRLIYDFGYIGTIIFILLYSKIIKRCKPRDGCVTVKTLFGLSALLPSCVVFFAGNALSSLNLDLGIIYCILFYKLFRTPRTRFR